MSPTSTTAEPLVMSLEDALTELSKRSLTLRRWKHAGDPDDWLVHFANGQIRGRGATWHEAVSQALGVPVVPIDEVRAWQRRAEAHATQRVTLLGHVDDLTKLLTEVRRVFHPGNDDEAAVLKRVDTTLTLMQEARP